MAITGQIWYGQPTCKMLVFGITGTSGKSTTVFLLDHILRFAGHKVGATSTIGWRVGEEWVLNNKKMTQLGRWGTARLLRRMLDAGCDVAIIETTSQGIEQFRHVGIAYDVALLTNLYPEHIEAHGGFENYKNAKKKLFTYTAALPRKEKFYLPKTLIVNGQVKSAPEFLGEGAVRKWSFLQEVAGAQRAFLPEDIVLSEKGISFVLDLTDFFVPLLGEHIVDDAVAAVAAAVAVGVSLEECAMALRVVPAVPGRIEFIHAGQPFSVIVDFAFEPRAMQKLYAVVEKLPHERVIHVLGGTGGGRDSDRRIILGNIAGEKATLVVVTNEDPYDEDPRVIMEMVADGARAVGKKEQQDLYLIDDRRQAINFALRQAQPKDIVLITGKGSEQAIVGKNLTYAPWDDRRVVTEEWQKIKP